MKGRKRQKIDSSTNNETKLDSVEKNPLQSELVARFQSLVRAGDDQATISSTLREFVLKECSSSGRGSPIGNETEWGEACWKAAVGHLMQPHLKWWLPATELLVALWDQYSEIQLATGKYVPRAEPAQFLTEFLWEAGERDTALRWSLHAHVAHIFSGNSPESGLPRIWLHGAFGFGSKAIEALARAAKAARPRTRDGKGWASPKAFPEDVVRRVAMHDFEGLALFSRFPSPREFHLCPAYLRSMTNGAVQISSRKKGQQLEDVAAYLCGLLPGCVPLQNLLDPQNTSEHDLVVQNFANSETISSHLFGRQFLVECKNLKKSVGTRDVGYFLYRMAMSQTQFGVIFARKDISGPEDKAAQALVQRAVVHNRSVCIIVTYDDLKNLGRVPDGTVRSFQDLLLRRISRRIYGLPRGTKQAD